MIYNFRSVPLLQRRHSLETDIERAQARLTAQLEQLQTSESQLSRQVAQRPILQEKAIAVDKQLQALDNKEVYQKRVHEKGLERRAFQQRLQENRRIFQEKLEELVQKLKLLDVPNALCPLCEQELDETHRHQVIVKTQAKQKDHQEQIWVLQEQISTCERELDILREEYQKLKDEISPRADLRQEFAQLEIQLKATSDTQQQQQKKQQEIKDIEKALCSGQYALSLQTELKELNEQLQRLDYNEQTHAIVRGEIDNLHWVDIKQSRIADANRRQARIDQEKPKIKHEIEDFRQKLQSFTTTAPICRQINQIESEIQALDYDRTQHQALLNSLREAQVWQLRYQELQQAKEQYPQRCQQKEQRQQRWEYRLTERDQLKKQLDQLNIQMGEIVDCRSDIEKKEQQLQQQRLQLDALLGEQGRLQQSLIQLDQVKKQSQAMEVEQQEITQKQRIYQELSQAFGKNGIQALMIENILPQLEAETNQILARLTGNQLHIQFVTQKARKSGSKRKTSKLIDTLEILIADSRGTRAYETYSGGEAFRINFAIRLALAQMLAQQAGTSLQMLIIDEGFSTQDPDGCDRLIAAINAISNDFSCILTVTHIQQFKEAFQYRIEVDKTDNGSRLRLLS